MFVSAKLKALNLNSNYLFILVLSVFMCILKIRMNNFASFLVSLGSTFILCKIVKAYRELNFLAALIISTILDLFLIYLVGVFFALFLPELNSVAFQNLRVLLPLIISTFFIFIRENSKLETNSKKVNHFEFILVYFFPISFSFYFILNIILGNVHSLTFALSGDSRNHIWLANQLTASGGLNPEVFQRYPAFSNYLISVISGTRNIDSIYSQIGLRESILSIQIITLLILLALSVLWVNTYEILRTKKPRILTKSIIANLPYLGLVSGVALNGGFYSALFAMFLLSMSYYLYGFSLNSNLSSFTQSLIAVAQLILIVLVAATWSLLATIPLFFVLLRVKTWIFRIEARRLILLTILIICIVISGIPAFTPFINSSQSLSLVKQNGAINAPPIYSAYLYLFLYLFLAIFNAIKSKFDLVGIFIPSLFFTFVVLYFVSVQEVNMRWNYYPAKVSWIIMSITYPVIISLGVNFLDEILFSNLNLPVLNFTNIDILSSSLLCFSILFVNANSISPFVVNSLTPRPFSYPNYINWNAPNSTGIKILLNYTSKNSQIPIAWDLLDPSNDRLFNFWSALTIKNEYPLKLTPSNAVSDWAYFENPTSVDSLCDLLKSTDYRFVIYTSNSKLNKETSKACQVSKFKLSFRHFSEK